MWAVRRRFYGPAIPPSPSKVFISSTIEDLKEFRQAVHDALESDGFGVRWAEDFSSGDEPPLERCKQELAKADIYVVILGYRYGARVGGDLMSYTDAEYEHARRTRRKVFAYVRHRFDQYVDRVDQPDQDRRALRDLRTELERAHFVSRPYFKDAERLGAKVLGDLRRYRDTGNVRPTFGRVPARIRDEEEYAVERTRRALQRLVNFPVVLLHLGALDVDEYPPSEAGVIGDKIDAIYRDLEGKEVSVLVFNDIPIDDTTKGAVVDQRLRIVKASARAIVCFARRDGDVAQLERLRDVADVLTVWAPEGVDIPKGVPVKRVRQFTRADLDECLLALKAGDAVWRQVNQEILELAGRGGESAG